jgi:2-dehydropantoate 2-reductase
MLMRILVVGAGSIGGYFGGRLLEAGRDVTFLVRARRAAQLASAGLLIRSAFGDVKLPAPPTVSAEALRTPFELVLLSCKAYDLNGAMDSVAGAVGPETSVLPLLNGLAHLDALAARFGAARILGGLCLISSTLEPDGQIVHLNNAHLLSFGECDGSHSARTTAIESALSGALFETRRSDAILQEMWEKWVFIASTAGITCLMRAAIGDIVAAGAADLAMALLEECAAIAKRNGYPPRADSMRRSLQVLTAAGSPITASMFRDIEHGAPIESEQILGDLLRRAGREVPDRSLLRVACAHVRAYEERRSRETGAARSG